MRITLAEADASGAGDSPGISLKAFVSGLRAERLADCLANNNEEHAFLLEAQWFHIIRGQTKQESVAFGD